MRKGGARDGTHYKAKRINDAGERNNREPHYHWQDY